MRAAKIKLIIASRDAWCKQTVPRETIFSGCEDLTVHHKFATQTHASPTFTAFLVSVLQISYGF
jgi:hypothetical protein